MLGNKTDLPNYKPEDPGAIEYDQALKGIGTMPAILPGTNTMDEYTTPAQPKDGLGGKASFSK